LSAKASPSDIAAYLVQVKTLLSNGKYDFVPRRKNMQALAQHGLTITDAKSEILGLVVSDYYKGPKQDYDPNRPGDIWEFKKKLLYTDMRYVIHAMAKKQNQVHILKLVLCAMEVEK
jgi:hypothetical protein